MKKLVSILLVMTMMVSLSLPVMAQGEAEAVNSAGSYSTYVIRSDSSLWGWGAQYTGNGDDYREAQVTPVKILDNVRSVSGGSSMSSVAVKKDDTLWGWGALDGYPVDTGEQDPTFLYPTQLAIDDVKSAAINGGYILALKNDDTLWLCGDMVIGDGSETKGDQTSGFVQIAEDVLSMHASSGSVFMIMKDNTLWAYGDNSSAQLGNMSDSGDGTANNSRYYTPVKILEDVKFVTADPDGGTVLAVRLDNSLYGWGSDGFYAEGMGWVEDAGKPYKVMDNVKSAAVDGANAFVIKTDHTLWAWGYNYEGKSISDETVPYYVTDKVQSVSMGERHASIVKKDNSLWTFGGNYRYALGYDIDETWYTPLKMIFDDVIDAPADWATTEVELAIGEKLVPEDMQSDYTKPVTREEFCILAIGMIEVRSGMTIDDYLAAVGTEIAPSDSFEDCDTKEVLAAKALGITDGTSPTTFDPDRLLTRQEAAKFLTTTAMACGRDVNLSTPAYADKEDIANWAQPYTGYVYDINVMKGVGGNNFDPTGGYQRQQAFMTMYRIWREIDAVDTDNVILPEGEGSASDMDTMYMGQDFSNPELADLLTVIKATFEMSPFTVIMEDESGLNVDLYYIADEEGFATATLSQYRDFNGDIVEVIEFHDGDVFNTAVPSLATVHQYTNSVNDKKFLDFGTRTEYVGKIVDGTYRTYTFRDLGEMGVNGMHRYYDYEVNMAYDKLLEISVYYKENDDSPKDDYGKSYGDFNTIVRGYSTIDLIHEGYTNVVDMGYFYDGENYPFWYVPE